ncbi:unnamed protein product [Rotaria sp. Silwood1]|nr:unnamed protein product [Rotaria sp. Silwood1]
MQIATLFAQGTSLIGQIGPYFQTFSEAQGSATPVFRMIDESALVESEREIWDEKGSTTGKNKFTGDIYFKNVNFSYPSRDRLVLNDLSFIARSGQTTALVGSSGCGKSTCFSLLLRFYEPSSGQISINNQLITSYNIKQLRENIGIVNQEPILFNTTIYENIRLGMDNVNKSDVKEAAMQANAHDFIMKMTDNYETILGERGTQLSGGEKQRIALARALLKKPALLLLDEATSALDNISEKITQQTLEQACKGWY